MKVYKFNLRFSVNAQFWLQKSVYPEKEKGSRPYICNNIIVYRYINLYSFCFKKYTSLHDIGFIISWPSLSFFMLSIEFDLEYTGNHRIRIHRSFLFENSLQYGLSSPWLLYLFLLLFYYYTSISCGKENCAWAHYIFSFVTIVFVVLR